MRKSYSTLGLMGMVTLFCTNALIGCYGGSAGRGRCGFPCPEERVVKEKKVIPIRNTPPTFAPPIIVEEFIYTATDPLNGLDGGTGWDGPWTADPNTWGITAPGLTHPAQISDTNVTGNNKATGINLGQDVSTTSLVEGARNLSAASVGLVSNALNSPGGLWYRYLVSLESGGELGFLVNLGSVGFELIVSETMRSPARTGGTARNSIVATITQGPTYMVVVNMFKADSVSGNFIVNAWLLDPTTNVFSVTLPPALTTNLSFGSLPINLPNASIVIFDNNTDSVDEIYMADSPQGLSLNVSP